LRNDKKAFSHKIYEYNHTKMVRNCKNKRYYENTNHIMEEKICFYFFDIALASQSKKNQVSMLLAEKLHKSKFIEFCETDIKFPSLSFHMSLILLNSDKNCGS